MWPGPPVRPVHANALRREVGLVLLSTTLALATPGWSRTVTFRGEPITVRLHHLQPTAVTFPEPIASVPTGADPKQLSLELDGRRLFLQPLEPQLKGRLFAIGMSGRNYPLHFTVATPADVEVVVVERSATPLPVAAPAGLPSPATPLSRLSVLGLLKALLRGTALPGVTAVADEQVLLEEAGLRLTTRWRYSAPPWRGYIAEARNSTDTPQPLRLPALTAPGLRAVAADTEVVPPQGTTRLYLVLEEGTP